MNVDPNNKKCEKAIEKQSSVPTQRRITEAALERLFYLLWQEAARRQVAPVFERLEQQNGGKASRLLAEAAAGRFYDLLWEEMKGRSSERGGAPGIALLENKVRSGAADRDTTALWGVKHGSLPEEEAGGDAAEIAEIDKPYPKAAETFENSGNAMYNSGALSGAYNDSNDPDGAKRDAHAERYYASLRNSKKKNIVETIARNAGVEEIHVSRMYDHLLVNEYDLDDGKKRFDASYEIAQSLQRLREGKNRQEHDIILIHHESAEYLLMNRDGMPYDDAHNIANEDYDYATALRKFLMQKDGE